MPSICEVQFEIWSGIVFLSLTDNAIMKRARACRSLATAYTEPLFAPEVPAEGG